jgi:hypothetical protein
MSNVKAIGTCVCYCLDRVHLDNELKASSEAEAQSAFQSLQALLAGNQKRNAAVAKNLSQAKTPDSKLSKMIVLNSEKKTSPLILALQNPNSMFCICWDIFGLFALVYYAISIPFHLAYFLHDDLIAYRPYLAFDFLIDIYWLIDIYLRVHYFVSPNQITDKYETEALKNLNHYRKSNRFKLDCVSSFPLEVLALVPGTSPMLIHFLRLIHLPKVFNAFSQISLLHLHLDHIDIRFLSASCLLSSSSLTSLLHLLVFDRIKSPVVSLFKAIVLYVLVTHWIACGYFMIHRYFLRHSSITWALADRLATYDRSSGTHNVCDKTMFYCYLRSFYFVAATLTSVGYGATFLFGSFPSLILLCRGYHTVS